MIKDKYQNSFNFKFEPVSTDQVIKFIDEIDCNKISSGDIPAKIDKIAKEEIAEPITNCINSSIATDIFPDESKIADIISVFKREIKMTKLTLDQLAFCLYFQKYLKKFFISRLKIFRIRLYHQNSVDLEKGIQRNMAKVFR